MIKKKENCVFLPVGPEAIFVGRCIETFLVFFAVFFIHYIMSDIENSDSDDSYRPEDDGDVPESEDCSSMNSDIRESDDESFILLGVGWSRVDVSGGKRPDPFLP